MEEDEDSIDDYFSDGVRPLSSKFKNVHQPDQAKRLKRPKQQLMDESEQDYLPLNYYQLEDLDLDAQDVISQQQTAMNHRHWKQFRLGNISYAKPLDLHGYQRKEAWEAVQNYVDHLYYSHQKYGLIIHGKGHFSADGKAYLKNMLASHLSKLPKILAFHSANQKDGGTGATYIAIKRNKEG